MNLHSPLGDLHLYVDANGREGFALLNVSDTSRPEGRCSIAFGLTPKQCLAVAHELVAIALQAPGLEP